MAGSSMISSTSRLTTSRLMTSAALVRVQRDTWTPFLSLTSDIVPKFQGENFYKNKAIVDEIKKLATRKGCTVAQIALAWVAAQGMITIPGTTRPGRLEENWGSRNVVLTDEEKTQMRKIVDDAKPIGERFSSVHQSMVGH